MRDAQDTVIVAPLDARGRLIPELARENDLLERRRTPVRIVVFEREDLSDAVDKDKGMDTEFFTNERLERLTARRRARSHGPLLGRRKTRRHTTVRSLRCVGDCTTRRSSDRICECGCDRRRARWCPVTAMAPADHVSYDETEDRLGGRQKVHGLTSTHGSPAGMGLVLIETVLEVCRCPPQPGITHSWTRFPFGETRRKRESAPPQGADRLRRRLVSAQKDYRRIAPRYP